MIYYPFKNYDEFKEMFGMVEHGNGVKSRKNKILLSLFKSKNLLHRYATGSRIPLGINWYAVNDMASLKWSTMTSIENCSQGYQLRLNGRTFRHPNYRTDDFYGICEDGDARAIRYFNVERERTFKMKAGKMFRQIIDGTECLRDFFPEQVKIWLSEEFAADWQAYAASQVGDGGLTLHVNDNFRDIYDSDECKGNFGSCMVDDGYWTFYRDAVKAKAAYLTDADGYIVARCIIYTEVYDEKGNVLRLAERQYSTNGDESLKRQLISRLVMAGEIDGYKTIGAGCSDAESFVDKNGNPFDNTSFHIVCKLEPGDTVSYQDSFKWFDEGSQTAYNYDCADECLSTTDGEFRDHRVWSEYYDRYIDEDDARYAEHRDDYFYDDDVRYCENTGTYEHEDDCVCVGYDYYYAGYNCNEKAEWDIYECPRCGEYFIADSDYYSELTDEYYCSDSCLERAEQEYKEENWAYSEYDGEYYEDGVIDAYVWNKWDSAYALTTIHEDKFDELVSEGRATEYDGDYFIDDVNSEGEPAHVYAYESEAA